MQNYRLDGRWPTGIARGLRWPMSPTYFKDRPLARLVRDDETAGSNPALAKNYARRDTALATSRSIENARRSRDIDLSICDGGLHR